MGKGKYLNEEEKMAILEYNSKGFSCRKIGQLLGRSANVVNNFVNNVETYGKNARAPCNYATTALERKMILFGAFNATLSIGKIKTLTGIKASNSTVHRIIKKEKRRRDSLKINPKNDLSDPDLQQIFEESSTSLENECSELQKSEEIKLEADTHSEVDKKRISHQQEDSNFNQHLPIEQNPENVSNYLEQCAKTFLIGLLALPEETAVQFANDTLQRFNEKFNSSKSPKIEEINIKVEKETNYHNLKRETCYIKMEPADEIMSTSNGIVDDIKIEAESSDED